MEGNSWKKIFPLIKKVFLLYCEVKAKTDTTYYSMYKYYIYNIYFVIDKILYTVKKG